MKRAAIGSVQDTSNDEVLHHFQAGHLSACVSSASARSRLLSSQQIMVHLSQHSLPTQSSRRMESDHARKGTTQKTAAEYNRSCLLTSPFGAESRRPKSRDSRHQRDSRRWTRERKRKNLVSHVPAPEILHIQVPQQAQRQTCSPSQQRPITRETHPREGQEPDRSPQRRT